ncbi:hypothetical protein TUM17564_13270 [Citrobacter freundii]|nr:hypothetical protein TUM17564_13270 [Citrobacter freundii]
MNNFYCFWYQWIEQNAYGRNVFHQLDDVASSTPYGLANILIKYEDLAMVLTDKQHGSVGST